MNQRLARYTLFETTVGRCGIAWSERGVLRVHLPERDESSTRERLLRGIMASEDPEPPPAIREAITRIVSLLEGEWADLAGVVLDLDDVPEFHQKVYQVARSIPPGSTLTYGEVAARVGEPGAAQAVGKALGLNPIPLIVPCHRVVAAGGKIGGFSANGGAATKIRLLSIESRNAPLLRP